MSETSSSALARITSALAAANAGYRIERELGAGGMATVYLAFDEKHDRKVAIKVLKPELAAVLGGERFLQEIKITANLQHPSILALFDSGAADGFLYYVMPFVEGETLRDRLNRERQLGIDQAVFIAKAVGSALDYAHRHGVIHRDIKPENILMQDGVPVVADFGIALAVKAAGGERLTETGLSLGTPSYMSPEQVAGERDVDARSDIYSLACVTYEMLAGDPPFVAKTAQAVLAKHMTDTPPPITTTRPTVTPAIAQALAKALQKTPADRFATAKAFADGLTDADATKSAKIKSLVVLPFANQSPDPDNAYFADGLTEEVISALSPLRGLRVISRNSAMALKGTTKDTRSIARELSVTHVVTGSVRRAANALRVTVELVDAESDAPVWSDRYSGTLDDVFGIQEEIARQIVAALEVTLTDKEQRRAAPRPVSDMVAYDCYLRARREMYTWTPDSMERADKLIREAIGIVGDNPLLLAMLGQISWMYVNITIRPDERYLVQAGDLVNRALALDPDHYLAIFVRGALAAQRGEVEAALRDVHRAMGQQPGDVNVALEMVRFLNGAGLTAMPLVDDIVQVDPLTPITWLAAAVAHGMAGTFDRVRPAVDRMSALVPVVSPLHIHAAHWLAVAGGRNAAIGMLAEAGEAFAGTPNGSWAMFLKCAYEGDSAGAASHLTPDLEQAAALVDHNALSLAEGFALLGRTDEALRWIRIAVDRSIVNYPFLSHHDPLLAGIRQDERFQRLLAEVRPRWEKLRMWHQGAFGWTDAEDVR